MRSKGSSSLSKTKCRSLVNCKPKWNSLGKFSLRCFVSETTNNLFGIEWIDAFDLWDEAPIAFCLSVQASKDEVARVLTEIQTKFAYVIEPGMGRCDKIKVYLQLKRGAQPVFRKRHHQTVAPPCPSTELPRWGNINSTSHQPAVHPADPLLSSELLNHSQENNHPQAEDLPHSHNLT